MLVILSPTIVRLIDDKDNSMITIELTEEDNKKEEKKGFDEKNIFFYLTDDLNTSGIQERNTISTMYPMKCYTSTLSILLPPPKLNI